MILGTKARYAVMAMVDLARYSQGRPLSLAVIAERQEISLPYLEQIFPKLKQAGLIRSLRGPGGGYLPSRSLENISILQIVSAVDESLEMTRCNKHHEKGCMTDKTQCLTHTLWAGLGKTIEDYLGEISLRDVCEGRVPGIEKPLQQAVG